MLLDKDIQSSTLNILREINKTWIKSKSIRMINNHTENSNEERDIFEKNQIEILKVKSIIIIF